MSVMSPEDFEREMKAIRDKYGRDHEAIHGRSDDLLCEVLRSLGYEAGIQIYDSFERWCA